MGVWRIIFTFAPRQRPAKGLPPITAQLPPGSRLQVEQQGRVYDLVCSGLPVRYPTHWETELRLLPKRA